MPRAEELDRVGEGDEHHEVVAEQAVLQEKLDGIPPRVHVEEEREHLPYAEGVKGTPSP